MNKKLLMGAGAGCAAIGGLAAARKHQSGPNHSKWDRMRQRMEEMPADFPPRVMFDNVAAIRASTDEILRLLREESA